MGGDQPLSAGAVPLIEVPNEIVESLGQGKRPKVRLTLNGHTYRSTVAVYEGRSFLPLNKENRHGARVDVGNLVQVSLELDLEEREVPIPEDLAVALDAREGAREAFENLSYTYRKEHVEAITTARQEETRRRRVERTIQALKLPQ